MTAERLTEAGTLAPLTAYGYSVDWKAFRAWCEQHERQALPAEEGTVSDYFIDRLNRGYKINTVARHLSAIRYYHLRDNLPSPCTPTVARLLVGARRLLCDRLDQREPLGPDDLRRTVSALDGPEPLIARNKAILLFGFATALRRSNLALLDLEDLQWKERGLVVSVRREKQDQRGTGRRLAVPKGKRKATCPVRALAAWIALRGSQPGPLFTQLAGRGETVTLKRLHPQRIYGIVKAAVGLIGLDPRRYGAHSLRAGFVTTAIDNGASDLQVAQQTGHRSLASLRRYYRPANLFNGNAAGLIGL